MQCIIIEDQPPAQRILKKFIEDIGTLQLVGTFPDAIQAMAFLQSNPVDLIFLDIHLPKISGIDFLKAMPHPPQVILTTAFPDYALESYEFNVVDYLLKPFSFQRFVKAVSKITLRQSALASTPLESPLKQEVFIKSGYEHIRVALSDIRYIKSDADYTEVNTGEQRHLSTESLRYWEEFLEGHSFYRIHRSYLVNTIHIVKVAGNQVHLSAGEVLPIGRTYKEGFVKTFLGGD